MGIPKILHYCWFGPKPIGKLQNKCISSWNKHLKDYEIKLWNETNSPMDHPFVSDAYEAGKYAFVADYVRLWALANEGGIYLDTDMLVLKGFDDLLIHDCFVGFQEKDSIAAGVIGAKAKHPYLLDLVAEYSRIKFDKENLTDITIPIIMSKIASEKEYKIKVFDSDYFYAFPFEISIEQPLKYKKYVTQNSYAVHLWDASWIDGMEEYRKGIGWLARIRNKIKYLFEKDKW